VSSVTSPRVGSPRGGTPRRRTTKGALRNDDEDGSPGMPDLARRCSRATPAVVFPARPDPPGMQSGRGQFRHGGLLRAQVQVRLPSSGRCRHRENLGLAVVVQHLR